VYGKLVNSRQLTQYNRIIINQSNSIAKLADHLRKTVDGKLVNSRQSTQYIRIIINQSNKLSKAGRDHLRNNGGWKARK
jgi:hypothetical protein